MSAEADIPTAIPAGHVYRYDRQHLSLVGLGWLSNQAGFVFEENRHTPIHLLKSIHFLKTL